MRGSYRAEKHSETVRDLRLSHAFVNTISGAFRGMWIFESAFEELAPGTDRSDELARSERVLETVDGWWRNLEARDPLFRTEERPVLEQESSRAWRLLQVAEARLRSLIGELTDSSDLETLLQEPLARAIGAAALRENAHVQREIVQGLVRFADMLDDHTQGDRWRQRLLDCERRVDEAEALVERLRAAGAEPGIRLLAELLDSTLVLPAQVAQRIVDICQVFSLYTGVFDYEDVGIPDAQTDIWADAGFEPDIAGRWFAAGMSPGRAIAWMQVGAEDPLVAAGFLWRGFTPDEAEPWLHRYISGRTAVAWAAAGCDAEDAREWITLGIHGPDGLSGGQGSARLM